MDADGMRAMGIVLALIGAAMAYMGLYLPLIQAEALFPSVSIAAIPVPLTVVPGLAWAVAPYRATALIGTNRRPTVVGWIVGAILLVIGICIERWVEARLLQLGYVRVKVPRH